MRLKSLEIKGFKSFANPTILYFDENVTGVVGPNGSGKSNVVDAFRWVLGEQKSKELRLEQMGDVLFNGSAGKKQANLAEVSITFDNTKNLLPTEYNNVKITRALYRSGESEYRINDVNCRLKDIHALLMDTGVGSNSYSIIELGMVDDILHDKENARRRMFEQAAGISKFKKRKKETIQKLKLTNADLERVEDLLFEIEKNLKDLEKQAKRTKKYFEIKEKYKDASIQLSRLKWDTIEEAELKVSKQIVESKDEYNMLSSSLTKKEAKLEEEKRKNLIEEKNLSDFQKNLNQLLDEIRQLENEKNLVSQKISFAKENLTKAESDLKYTQPVLVEAEEISKSLGVQLLEKEQLYKAERSLLDEKQKDLDKINSNFQDNKDFQENKYKELQANQSQIFEIEKKLAVFGNRGEGFSRELQSNTGQISSIKDGVAGRNEELKALNDRLAILTKEISIIQSKEENRVKNIENLEDKITSRKETISKLNRKIDALSNEQLLLQSMVENLEGFPESVKYLHSQWKTKKVLLSDVINCEEKYRAAVEQYLQQYLNFFIVENAQEAQNAIALLKNAQKGKAQFFLLDQIPNAAINNDIKLTALSEVIEVDKKYEGLLKLICSDVYLVSENEIYDAAFLDKHPSCTLLDHDGSLLRNKNSISGGSVGLFEGKKIGRKKRIDHLAKVVAEETAKLSKASNNLTNELEQLKDLKHSRYGQELKTKERDRAILDSQSMVIKTKLESADDDIAKYLRRNEEINTKAQQIEAEMKEASIEKKNFEDQIQKLQSEVSKNDESLQALNAILSEARSAFNGQNIKLIQTENYVISLKKDLDHQSSKIRDLKQKIYNAEQSLNNHSKEISESEQKLDDCTSALSSKYESKTKQEELLSGAEQNYFKARGTLNEIEDEIRKTSKVLSEKQSLINQMKDKLNDFKFKKNSIKERLQIEFSIDIWTLIEIELAESIVETELELAVEKYRRRLDNYGEINPMALEAYDEMDSRYVHIKEQRNDINEAKESLMNTISEIEETATKLFLDSFEMVRKHFVVVFRSLFTQDDDCDLILETPDDPLNSKIEIIAKPKGKRPKSLSQLSGGEKTLTATALLFSLYLLKPAPFCIFDEVDAPLDDTNIQKFANIIRAFSDKSQFIVVTHNKSTMAEVDVLYGVFMQKKGVSSVSSVDFRSYEEKGTVQNMSLSTMN